jgi:hypothetical protein
MKKTIITLIGIVAAVALFWGCSDDVTTTRTYVAMEPVSHDCRRSQIVL